MMQEISFSQLAAGHFAFIDLASLRILSDSWSKLNHEQFKDVEQVWEGEVARKAAELPWATEVLMRTIAFDRLIIDRRALETVSTTKPFSPKLLAQNWIAATEVPDAIYVAARTAISEFIKRQQPTVGWMMEEFFDWEEKILHDNWGKEGSDLPFIFHLADSSDTIARLLFYLEICDAAKVPTLLSPAKRKLFTYVKPRVEADALKVIENAIDTAMRNEMLAISENAELIKLPIPPLLEFVSRAAVKRRVPLAVAADQIRNSEDAVGFRKWLAQIQKLLLVQDRASAIQLTETLGKLRKHVTEWTNHGNAEFGVNYVERELKLENLPVIGWPAKLLGAGTRTIRDKVFTKPPSYVAFVSDWFS